MSVVDRMTKELYEFLLILEWLNFREPIKDTTTPLFVDFFFDNETLFYYSNLKYSG